MLRKGFTILELLVVVIIVGVLATLGFVQYGGVREASVTKEARANLKLIAAAERIYRMEVGYFYPRTGVANVIATINDDLRLSLPEANNRWDYTINSQNNFDLFNATATRTTIGNPTAAAIGCQWTMDQGDTQANAPAAGCPQ